MSKAIIGILLLMTSVAAAFIRLSSAVVPKTTIRRSLMMAASVPTKPKLYVYDHCPYCVRARMIFGLKKIDHQLIFLDNDDVETPTALVGKKVVPILEYVAEDGSRVCQPESMDIVKRMDEEGRFGAPMLKPATNREDIKAFWESVTDLQRRLTRPRFARSSILPEFHTAKAREAFVRNHPIKAPSDYEENLTNKSLVEAMNAKLQEVDALIHSADSVSPEGLSYDDIDFYGKFRGLTVIKGLKVPPKLNAYLENFSSQTEIPLYYQMSI